MTLTTVCFQSENAQASLDALTASDAKIIGTPSVLEIPETPVVISSNGFGVVLGIPNKNSVTLDLYTSINGADGWKLIFPDVPNGDNVGVTSPINPDGVTPSFFRVIDRATGMVSESLSVVGVGVPKAPADPVNAVHTGTVLPENTLVFDTGAVGENSTETKVRMQYFDNTDDPHWVDAGYFPASTVGNKVNGLTAEHSFTKIRFLGSSNIYGTGEESGEISVTEF